MRIRYSRWDGTQTVGDVDADDVLDAISDDVLQDGDLWSALRRLFQHGARDPQGGQMPGLRDLMERLRRQRQERLNRFDLDSTMDDVRKRLEDVIKTEGEGIIKQTAEAKAKASRGEMTEKAQKQLDRKAAQHLAELNQLPPDPAGRLKELRDYDFMDPEAKQKFEDLLNSLRQQMMKPFMQGMQQSLQNLTPEDLKRMREMINDLNRMLRNASEGKDPGFEQFKQKWGDQFPGVESFEDLLEHLARQMAQMQSLMQSLSPEQRQQLQDMMRQALLQDERLEAAMAQLAAQLGEFMPLDEMSRRYPFRGDEDVSLEQAAELMDEMQRMDQLEQQLRRVDDPSDLDQVDPDEVQKLLGEEARRDLERLRELTKKLEEAGYLERDGDKLSLTARAMRKIADKALRDIFAQLKRDRFGGHAIRRRGAGGDQTDETKPYEFGDPFLLDLKQTVMNAVERAGAGTPVRLEPNDFEVYRTELRTQSSTVVMLDLSRSMINNGYFMPAKKVVLALHALIKGQFPRDSLYIVGFALYARQLDAAKLPTLSWGETNIGTNMHAGFMLSRQLLGRNPGGNKQIIMVTDGEPTAHMEGTEPYFAYPPTRRTVEETLMEVQRCTREGITINTFMLAQSPWLTSFVEQMARINRGRAFFSSPDRLGEYVLVDYVRGKRRAAS